MKARRQLGTGISLRLLALCASTTSALWITPFVVHRLGDRSYGLWTLVATIGNYYGLLELGLSGSVTRHMADAVAKDSKDEVNRIASTALVAYLVIGVAVCVLSLACAALAPLFFSSPGELSLFRTLVVISGLGTAVTIPARAFIGIINAHLRFDRSAALDILSILLRASLIWPLIKMGVGVVALGWINLAVALVVLAAGYRSCKSFNPTLNLSFALFDRPVLRKLARYGTTSCVIQIADILRFQLDGWIVAAFLGVGAVTHYNIAGTLIQYFISLMLAATGVLGPIFSRHQARCDEDRMRVTLAFGTRASVALSMFVCFCILAYGRPFISWWMGPKYLDAFPPLAALAVGTMVAVCQTPCLQLLYGISKHGWFAVFNSAEGLANLVLSLFLVRSEGLLGVALGTMIPMMLCKLFIQPWYSCRVAGFKVSEYYRNLACSAGFCVAALALPCLLLEMAPPRSFGAAAWQGLASLLCYVSVLWFALFKPDEREVLQSMAPAPFARVLARQAAEG